MAVIALRGDLITVNFKWKNVGGLGLGIAPVFRIGIRSSDAGSTWLEGDWVNSPMVEDGQTSSNILCSKEIPGDWGEGKLIDVQLRAKLDDYFGESEIKFWENEVEIANIGPEWISLEDVTIAAIS